MFIEPRKAGPSNDDDTAGWIEVISGCMFSGKTEELLRRIKRATYANLSTAIFKAELDTRYDTENVVSHNQRSSEAIRVKTSAEILPFAEDYQVVGIDEAQFFDENLADVCTELAAKGKRVIAAGLVKTQADAIAEIRTEEPEEGVGTASSTGTTGRGTAAAATMGKPTTSR